MDYFIMTQLIRCENNMLSENFGIGNDGGLNLYVWKSLVTKYMSLSLEISSFQKYEK